MNYRYIITLLLIICVLFQTSCTQHQDGRSSLRIGNKQYNRGLFNNAESYYLKSIEENPSTEALYGRGNSKQRLQQTSSGDKQSEIDSVSLSSYQTALDQPCNNRLKKSKIFYNMGYLCYMSGLRNQKMQRFDVAQQKFNESAEYYKSSLRENPDDDDCRYNLAMALYMIDKNRSEQNDKNKDQSSENNNQENQNQEKKQQKDNQDKDKSNSSESDKSDQEKDNDNENEQNSDKQNKQDNNKEKSNPNQDNTENKDNKSDQDNKNKQDNSTTNNSNDKKNHTSTNNSAPFDTRHNKVEGKIDEKTANQLLNAAQQDENKVQKKIEKAIGTNNSYEKDW